MGKASIFQRFQLSGFKRMYINAKLVSGYSGKSVLYVLFDMAKCILKDHVGYMEYNMFRFVEKNEQQRASFITFDYSQTLLKKVNQKEYVKVFNNKLIFNQHFKDYLGRDFIDAAHCSDDEFIVFCKGKDKIYCKPVSSCSGQGIYKRCKIDSDTDLLALHQFMIDNDLFCEDEIVQCDEMNKLNETSINTIRIATVIWNGQSHFMYAIVRMGLTGMQVDNAGSGGVYTILTDEGKIVYPAWSDKTMRVYDKHPTSGFDFKGFQIPMFKEAIDLCLKAAEVEPHMAYIGWDVAITDKGPVLVEGNELPAYDMPQNCCVYNREYGIKPDFEAIIGKIQ